ADALDAITHLEYLLIRIDIGFVVYAVDAIGVGGGPLSSLFEIVERSDDDAALHALGFAPIGVDARQRASGQQSPLGLQLADAAAVVILVFGPQRGTVGNVE